MSVRYPEYLTCRSLTAFPNDEIFTRSLVANFANCPICTTDTRYAVEITRTTIIRDSMPSSALLLLFDIVCDNNFGSYINNNVLDVLADAGRLHYLGTGAMPECG